LYDEEAPSVDDFRERLPMPLPEKCTLSKNTGRSEIFLSLARVKESSRLFLGASDGNVYEIDLAVEKPEFKSWEGHSSYVTGLALAGETLISGSYDGKLIWRSIVTGEITRTIEAHARWIRKVAISPDGQRVASVADDMICRVWEVESGKLVHELKGHEARTPNHFPSMLYTVAFSPTGQHLATADRIGQICVWDVNTGAKVQTLQAPGFYTWDPRQRIHSIGGIRSLAFSPDGERIVAGGIGHINNIDHLDGPSRVEYFAWEKGEKLHEFLGDAKGLVESLVFGPDGKWVVGVGGDNGGLIQVYDLEAKKVVRSDKAPMHVHAAALSETADKLFACGHGKVGVWDLA
jgi:WD40 repeat protein